MDECWSYAERGREAWERVTQVRDVEERNTILSMNYYHGGVRAPGILEQYCEEQIFPLFDPRAIKEIYMDERTGNRNVEVCEVNERIERLRKESFDATPIISIERAMLETRFYEENLGKHSTPVLRAMVFKRLGPHLCENKKIYIGDDELIVGERGPAPKAVSTFPELTCHSVEDLKTLNDRPMTGYRVSGEDIETYRERARTRR